MAKTLKVIHNLDRLTDQEIAQYLRDVSEYVGLDPDLNAFDVLWIPDEITGMKKLVVYARKGTTDILRGMHGIEITSLIQLNIPGTASFQATGKNKGGRQEIAVGSHSIEGLKAQKLADAVMTAQTRALRRLTLQFVGLGILDETEVSLYLSNIALQAVSQATLAGSPVVMPPPQVLPNTTVGKDITERPEKTFEGIQPAVPDFAAQQEAMRQEALAQLKGSLPKLTKAAVEPVAINTGVPPTGSQSVTSEKPEAAPEAAPAKPPRKPRAPRKPRNTVDIASPGQPAHVVGETVIDHDKGTVTHKDPEPEYPFTPDPPFKIEAKPVQTEMPVGKIDANGFIVPGTAIEFVEAPRLPAQTVKFTQEAIAAAEKISGTTPPAVEETKAKEYRERLKVYSNDILPKGGMMPSEGIGGVTMKLRKFAAIFAGVSDQSKLSNDNWEALFEFLDGNKDNPKYLVDYIDKAIGVNK
jgi:hypothetical protein